MMGTLCFTGSLCVIGSDIKPKVDLCMPCGEPKGQDLLNGQASNGLEDLEEEDDSDTSSPPLPYLHQGPAPDGCCTMDGKGLKKHLILLLSWEPPGIQILAKKNRS